MVVTSLDTLKKRVRVLKQTRIESLDLGPINNGKLLYQDDVEQIHKDLRDVSSRLNKRLKDSLELGKNQQTQESIDKISDGNPDAFNEQVNAHSDVLRMLITNPDLMTKLGDTVAAIQTTGANEDQTQAAIGHVLENLIKGISQNNAE